MKKQKLFLCALALSGALALASCNGKPAETTNSVLSTGEPENTTTNTNGNTTGNENVNVVDENQFFVAHTANDYEKNVDTEKLERFNPSLKQKIMIQKAVGDLNFTSAICAVTEAEAGYYLNGLHERKSVMNFSSKYYSNDVLTYSMNSKVTVDGMSVDVPSIMPLPYKAAKAISAKVAIDAPVSLSRRLYPSNYTETTTCAYYNNYVYTHQKNESAYGNVENNNVKADTLDKVISNFKAKLNLDFSSFISMASIYKLDDNHFVTKFMNGNTYSDTIKIGTDDSNNDITDKREFMYSTEGTIYLSYFNDTFYVDYAYLNNSQKSNYIQDQSNNYSYVKCKDMVTLHGGEIELVLNHNTVGEYDKKAEFVNDFGKVISVNSSDASVYIANYNSETNAIESINSNGAYSAEVEVVSKTSDTIDLNISYNICESERLYSFDLDLGYKTLKAEVTKGEKIDNCFDSKSFEAAIDFSNVKLPEGFSLVTYEGKTYVKAPVFNSNRYYAYTNVTAKINEKENKLECKVNSVDFIEIKVNESLMA